MLQQQRDWEFSEVLRRRSTTIICFSLEEIKNELFQFNSNSKKKVKKELFRKAFESVCNLFKRTNFIVNHNTCWPSYLKDYFSWSAHEGKLFFMGFLNKRRILLRILQTHPHTKNMLKSILFRYYRAIK